MGRALLVSALTGLLLAPAGDAARGLRFTSAPARVVQGHVVRVAIAVRPTNGRCTLTVRYADGARQGGLRAASARPGRAVWSWRVPAGARPGQATLMAWCARSGKVTRRMAVAEAVVPARVQVAKQGFSQRIDNRRNLVSYGVVLANPSPHQDALDVYVLVNFIDASGRVVGSDEQDVAGVGAGATYNLGGSASLSANSLVDRLELVVKMRGRGPRGLRRPGAGDVRIVPDSRDGGYVGSVDGYVVNDHPTLDVASAHLSIVLFDAAGAVVGGATDNVRALLPPGARVFFSARTGVSAVRVERAATALVSINARYEQSG